jgi:hypothetical protein
VAAAVGNGESGEAERRERSFPLLSGKRSRYGGPQPPEYLRRGLVIPRGAGLIWIRPGLLRHHGIVLEIEQVMDRVQGSRTD